MNESQELALVCGVLLTCVAMLSLMLTLFSPCIQRRNKGLGVAVFFILGITVVSSALNFYRLIPLPLFIYLDFTIFAYWGSFVRPALRPLPFRLLISWPTAMYLLHFVQGNHVESGLLDNSEKPKRERAIRSRKPLNDYAEEGQRVLKIAQITDPHLGTFMSAERLHDICTTIADWNPDLVFLTGDFTTIESYFEHEKLAYGFSPLKPLKGKLFACLGNHDYESPETVDIALRETGVNLLKDDRAVVETHLGPVEILGTTFTFDRNESVRQEHMERICRAYPRPDYPRLCLVHNPEEFTHFPNGTADLVFSGHTHGGQIGLFSLGLNLTMYGLFTRKPDHGLWRKGNNRLYHNTKHEMKLNRR